MWLRESVSIATFCAMMDCETPMCQRIQTHIRSLLHTPFSFVHTHKHSNTPVHTLQTQQEDQTVFDDLEHSCSSFYEAKKQLLGRDKNNNSRVFRYREMWGTSRKTVSRRGERQTEGVLPFSSFNNSMMRANSWELDRSKNTICIWETRVSVLLPDINPLPDKDTEEPKLWPINTDCRLLW